MVRIVFCNGNDIDDIFYFTCFFLGMNPHVHVYYFINLQLRRFSPLFLSRYSGAPINRIVLLTGPINDHAFFLVFSEISDIKLLWVRQGKLIWMSPKLTIRPTSPKPEIIKSLTNTKRLRRKINHFYNIKNSSQRAKVPRIFFKSKFLFILRFSEKESSDSLLLLLFVNVL